MAIKIAITGHTKGLGKHLFDSLSQKHDIIGFSRSNGYDIKNPNHRKKIIEESKECDILINLVHNYYHQTDLLFEFHQSWSGKEKLIICIGTKAVHDKAFGNGDYSLIEYRTQKKNMITMIENLQNSWKLPHINLYEIQEINFEADVENLNKIVDIHERKIFKK
tara:strand:+ start:838 stop:1329 length:492 start_codon:yes stop_codon:yes gene_type:complete